MTAREFLENARRLNRLIESTRETLEYLSDVQAMAPRQGGKSGMNENNEENKAIRRVELEDKLAEYIDSLWDYKEALVRLTTNPEISHVSKILIQQHYMLGRSWKEVAKFLGYDEVYTRRELNDEAIHEAEKMSALWCGIKFPY